MSKSNFTKKMANNYIAYTDIVPILNEMVKRGELNPYHEKMILALFQPKSVWGVLQK